jgi:arylsulfatase A-like enzyme
MRILYLDIDTLRPDHLGCYGYHRNTSPNIDTLAQKSVRFDNLYVSDAPCLPSRTALWSGRTGYHTGVVGHGGTAADPYIEGPTRDFTNVFGKTSWMAALRKAGFHTVTISPFAERHSAWHWLAGYSEVYNPGFGGLERAEQITPLALDWLKRNAQRDNWFLHVNLWDPHTPYRTPIEFGNPFKDDPLPEWLTEEVWRKGWEGYGPHSPQEPHGFGGSSHADNYDTPQIIDSMEAVKRWIDGYDTGIRYADDHVGQILNALSDAGLLEETVIFLSSDHGETQGEMNVWGDHQTADSITCRVPLLVSWPGLTTVARVERALHYHFDWAATLLELVGANVPANWDGASFTQAFREGREEGRPYLVTSQMAWACQRGVRFEDYICLRTYHDGYKMLEPIMLFNLAQDPHELNDLADQLPQVVNRAMALLVDWEQEMALTSQQGNDPMLTVLREGGPFHTRGELPAYLERLRATGRGHYADLLAKRHAQELLLNIR